MRVLLGTVGLAMAVVVLSLTPGLMNGQVVEIRREILDSQRRLGQVRQERSSLRQELNNLDGRVRDASVELANVERLVSISRSALAEVDFQVGAVGEEIENAARNLLHTRERLKTGTAVLHRRLRDIYKRGTLHSARVMLGSGSFSDLLTRYRYLRLIASYDRSLVRNVKQLETDLVQQNDNLQASMTSLGRLRQSRLGEVASFRAVEQRHLRAIDDYRAREARATSRLDRLTLDEARIGTLLTELEVRRTDLERATARPGAAATALTAPVGTMDWPVDGELVYRFGREVRPNGTVLPWAGIGIRAPTGTPVRAVEAGAVVFAAPFEGYGLSVWINHGGGFYTLYLYLNELRVTEGREVAAGDVVGTVGGATTPEGPHLEFQIRAPTEGGLLEALDPLAWLRAPGG